MSKIKNGGLDQYGAGPFGQQQFGTGGVERVNFILVVSTNAIDRMERLVSYYVSTGTLNCTNSVQHVLELGSLEWDIRWGCEQTSWFDML